MLVKQLKISLNVVLAYSIKLVLELPLGCSSVAVPSVNEPEVPIRAIQSSEVGFRALQSSHLFLSSFILFYPILFAVLQAWK